MADIQTNEAINVTGDLHARNIRVVQNITIETPDPPAKNVRFKVEKPIQTFIGRETFLEELHKVVKEGQNGEGGGVTVLTQESLSVVAATGGIGKTETVRRYIQLHEHEYDHIIWIDAEEISFAQRQFLQLATELKISTDFEGKRKEFDSILKEIFAKLLLNAHTVLLVLDNAEALEDDEELNLSGIRSLRPRSLSPFFVEPTIIVTSRNQNWSLQKVIHLDLWNEAEVVIFVIGRLGLVKNPKNTSLAVQLGTLFGRLPIALQSAVAVILQQTRRKKNYGIGTLIDEYDNGCRKVLAQKPLDANMRPTQTSIPMLVLWNISLEKILTFKHGALAIKILCFMSYMSPTRIPQDFLYSLIQNDSSQDSFENAIVILEDFSLIVSLSSDEPDSHSLSIHRMIQESTIENLRTITTNEGEMPHAIFSANTFLNEAEVLLKLSAESRNYLKTFTSLTFPRREVLVETLVQITNHVSGKLDVEEFRDLTVGVAEVLNGTNNLTKSIVLFERALEATPAPWNNIEIFNKLKLQQVLAGAYGKKGHFQKSLDLCLEVLKVRTLILGPNHESTLNTKCRVAAYLHNLKRYDEATKMHQEVLQAYDNNRNTQSKQCLLAKSSFSFLLFSKGEKKLASELLTQVSKQQKKDPDSNTDGFITITTNSIIAHQLETKGHLEEASKMRLQNIEDAIKHFGPFAQNTLDCRRTYASALFYQGKYEEASLLLLELLETEQTQFGSDHPSTLETKLTLGAVYFETKEFDKAEALLDVEVMKRVLDPEHPTTLEAATVLSDVKKEQGKFREALALSKKVLKVRKKILVPNHKDTLSTKQAIGTLYYKMEEYEKAASLLWELLETQETQLGPDHPSTLKTKLILGLAYFATNEFDKAVASVDVHVWEKVFGPEDSETLKAATFLADVKEEQDNFGEALVLNQKVFQVRKNVLEPNHKDTLYTMDNIGNLYYKMEKYEKAVKVAQKLLERQMEAIGKEHPDAIKTLELITSCREFINYQTNSIIAFMALTSVDAETGKSFLEALNWNLEAALEAYRNSNPDALVADQSHASTSSETTTDAKNHDYLILNFMAVTGVDTEIGKFFLQASDWNLEVALQCFFDSSSDKDNSDIGLQDDASIPSAAATDNENLNMATAVWNETKSNKIRDLADLRVQAESVQKSNCTTTPILFRFPGGARLQGEFHVFSTVRDLYQFVKEKRPDLAESNYVLTMYPNTELTEMGETLEEANLLNNVALTLKMLKK